MVARKATKVSWSLSTLRNDGNRMGPCMVSGRTRQVDVGERASRDARRRELRMRAREAGKCVGKSCVVPLLLSTHVFHS